MEQTGQTTLLVTGGAGFIGSALVRLLLASRRGSGAGRGGGRRRRGPSDAAALPGMRRVGFSHVPIVSESA